MGNNMIIIDGRQYEVTGATCYDSRNRSNVETWNGRVVAQGVLIHPDEVEFDEEKHQTRQLGANPKHLEDLEEQIRRDGIKSPTTIEWDKAKNKYRILSGHHRFQAQVNIGGKVTTTVVEFDNDDDRDDYMNNENATGPDAKKVHTHQDVIDQIRAQIARGRWSGTKKQQRDAVEKWLKKVYKGSKHVKSQSVVKRIVNQGVDPTRKTKIKSWTAKLAKNFVKRPSCWGHEPTRKYNFDESLGSTVSVVSSDTAYHGPLFRAAEYRAHRISKARQQSQKPAHVGIKVAIYVTVQDGYASDAHKSVKDSRNAFLRRTSACNTNGVLSNTPVEKVVFLPQLKGVEDMSKPIIYGWNNKKSDWDKLMA